MADERCPSCHALVSPDADWCGQCFAPLAVPERSSGTAPRGVVVGGPTVEGIEREADRGATKVAAWTYPSCGEGNAIELDECRVCGTSFASLLKEDAAEKDIDPRAALKASLVFPGLGHRLLGRQADGLARGVLFVLALTMTLLMLLSGARSGALGVIVLVYLFATLALYLGSAFEASRMARGAGPIISARALLWSTVGFLVGSLTLIAFVGFKATTG